MMLATDSGEIYASVQLIQIYKYREVSEYSEIGIFRDLPRGVMWHILKLLYVIVCSIVIVHYF